MSAIETGLILLVIALGGTLLSFLAFLLLRASRRPDPFDPLAPAPRTLEALGYSPNRMRGPRGVELVILRSSGNTAARNGVRREPEPGREGEELPSYETARKSAVPEGFSLPALEGPPPAVVRNAPLPPEYEARTS